MLGLAFWLMMVGMREERAFPFSAGVLYFLAWSVMRYADLFGEFGGMLGASCMFFTCGLAIAGFALYWHRRKAQKRSEREAAERDEAADDETVMDSAPETGFKRHD
jgi:hypothetical protein